jgi:quercetin dioxygenase-like cupin family protein
MIIRQTDSDACAPLSMDGVQGVSMRVMLGREDGTPNFAMRHFVVEPGGHTPRHSHDYEHEVVILSGEGEAFDDGTVRRIASGDVLFVGADDEHQFRNTGSEPLEFLCMVPLHGACGSPVPAS